MPIPAFALLMAAAGNNAPTNFVPPVAGYVHLWDVTKVTLVGGNTVSQIDDQGSGNIDMQSTSLGKRPGYPVTLGTQTDACNFDGASPSAVTDYMDAASVAIDGDHTIFICCDITSTTTRILFEHSLNWNSNNGMICNPNSSAEMGYGVRRSGSNSARFATTTTTGEHVWTFRSDGTHANQTIRKDGSNLSTTSVGAGYNNNVGTGTVTTGLYLGARGTNDLGIAMDFGLLLIYNSTLSDGDCGTTEAAIAAHFGI
jgi:hypothetical protein